jgi:hypothetical protein
METTSKEDIQKILDDAEKFADNCENGLKELDAMKEGKQFLLDQYKTNKHWFREEPGRVTVEDVIKMAFEFGWSSKRQFDYEQSKK